MPRLDVSFKEGDVPEKRGPIIPIREHWNNFAVNVINAAYRADILLDIEEKPLWQFNEEDYQNHRADTILVPHKEIFNFIVPGKRTLFYMQSVIPHLFSIDSKGWAGNLSILPFREDHSTFKHWEPMKERIKNNISKFDQPEKKSDFEPGYVLFLCQIPHDQTIIYHSQVSVYAALEETINVCKALKKRLVVKGHPVNPASMETLRRLVENEKNKNIIWVDDISIHSLIENSGYCVTVNSGSGIEVILHEKPIYAFGNAEYSELVPRINFQEWLDMGWQVDLYDYMNFIESYVNAMYDTTKPETFDKLF